MRKYQQIDVYIYQCVHVMIVSVVDEESVHLSLDGSNHSFAKVSFVIILGDIMFVHCFSSRKP